MNEQFGLGLDFIEANVEDVPLPDASFDLAFLEYGASIWCDPYRWVPEAARLLRPGGELAFICNTDMLQVCSPDEEKVAERLIRPGIGGSLSDA
jgi:ubiquinone/menaquinone biosynthesis C-methylase UbiE